MNPLRMCTNHTVRCPAVLSRLQRNAKFKHHGKDDFILNVPEFTCRPGELVAIVGRVGAGKSSLVHAILGNMSPVQGTSEAGGRVSYVPQNPWCQNLSLRDNITFGLPFDEEKYSRVSVLLLLGVVMGSISHGGVNCSVHLLDCRPPSSPAQYC
jgi:ABC-type transport system involved in cytochrome bd biosynthesis fused ATPase/permease subunit